MGGAATVFGCIQNHRMSRWNGLHAGLLYSLARLRTINQAHGSFPQSKGGLSPRWNDLSRASAAHPAVLGTMQLPASVKSIAAPKRQIRAKPRKVGLMTQFRPRFGQSARTVPAHGYLEHF